MANLVSVVVPNYNHANYLNSRLGSIRQQSFRDFEIIFLDDASTDDSLRVAKTMLEKMTAKVIVNHENSGSPFVQWNRGVEESLGKYIWIAESDDEADPRLLETLVCCLESDSSLAMACCQSESIDSDGNGKGLVMRSERWVTDFVSDGLDRLQSDMLFSNRIPNASAVLFRRDAYLLGGGADDSMRLCGDWAAWNRLLFQGGLAYSAKPLNRFRTHGKSVRASTLKSEVYVCERYRIASEILANLDIGYELRQRMIESAAMDWAVRMISPGGIMSPAANRRISKVAKTVDRYALQRALSALPLRLMRSKDHGKR